MLSTLISILSLAVRELWSVTVTWYMVVVSGFATGSEICGFDNEPDGCQENVNGLVPPWTIAISWEICPWHIVSGLADAWTEKVSDWAKTGVLNMEKIRKKNKTCKTGHPWFRWQFCKIRNVAFLISIHTNIQKTRWFPIDLAILTVVFCLLWTQRVVNLHIACNRSFT